MSSEEATASAATAIEPVAGTKRSRGNEVGEEVPEPKRSKIVVPIIEADPIDTPEGLTEIVSCKNSNVHQVLMIVPTEHHQQGCYSRRRANTFQS